MNLILLVNTARLLLKFIKCRHFQWRLLKKHEKFQVVLPKSPDKTDFKYQRRHFRLLSILMWRGTSCILPHVLRLMCTTIPRQCMRMFPSKFCFVFRLSFCFPFPAHISSFPLESTFLGSIFALKQTCFRFIPHYSTSMFNMNSIEIYFLVYTFQMCSL